MTSKFLKLNEEKTNTRKHLRKKASETNAYTHIHTQTYALTREELLFSLVPSNQENAAYELYFRLQCHRYNKIDGK